MTLKYFKNYHLHLNNKILIEFLDQMKKKMSKMIKLFTICLKLVVKKNKKQKKKLKENNIKLKL